MDDKNKMDFIDELETSDSSLEKYLNDLEHNNEYLEFENNENEFQKNIFDYVKQKEQEQNELLEMREAATQTRNSNLFVRRFIKYAKIAFITIICVSLTRTISNINVDNKVLEDTTYNSSYENFKNSFSQVREYLISYEKIEESLKEK